MNYIIEALSVSVISFLASWTCLLFRLVYHTVINCCRGKKMGAWLDQFYNGSSGRWWILIPKNTSLRNHPQSTCHLSTRVALGGPLVIIRHHVKKYAIKTRKALMQDFNLLCSHKSNLLPKKKYSWKCIPVIIFINERMPFFSRV